MKYLREMLAKLAKTDEERAALDLFFRGDRVVLSPLFEGGTRLALRQNGAAISDEKRDELLAKCLAGEHVEIDLEVDAYEQKPGDPNRNFVKFRDGIMLALGRTGVGVPFLRNHDQHDVMARGGTVIASRTEKLGDGHYVIRMTVRLSAPWAVELALRGLLDAVSIGWNPLGPVECSHCKAEIFSKCYHFPGDEIAGDAKKGIAASVVEWVFTEAELIELSGVNIGGVRTAQIKDIRALAANLSAHATGLRLSAGGFNPSKETEMDPEILKLLGLDATATMEQYTAAIAQRLAQGKADAAELTILGAEMKTLAADANAAREEKRQAAEDKFILDAINSGRIAKGDEAAWRDLYKLDAKRAETRMGERAEGSATPVGLPRQSGGADPSPIVAVAGGTPRSAQTFMGRVKQQLALATPALERNALAQSYASRLFGRGDTVLAGPTAISNNEELDAARIAFNVVMLESVVGDPGELQMLATETPSNKATEAYKWLGDLPAMEEWKNDRIMSMLKAYGFQIENKDWQATLRVKNNDFKDDALGLLPAHVSQMGAQARLQPAELIARLILNGFDGSDTEVGDGLAFDGAFFFDTTHATGSNKLTVAFSADNFALARKTLRLQQRFDGKNLKAKTTHLFVGVDNEQLAEKVLQQDYLTGGESNTNKGKAALVVCPEFENGEWFVADLSGPIKPVIFQNREGITTTTVGGVGNSDVVGFQYNETWFGAQSRNNAGYLDFRRIVGSKP